MVLFLVSSTALAQERLNYTYNKTSLRTILNELETGEGISFSFASDIIDAKDITLSENQLTLDELFVILEAQTSLEFKRVSKDQVVVAPRVTNDQICGYVLDIQTKLPIPFATISDQDGSIVLTDEKGFFAFAKANEKGNLVTIRSLGYATKEGVPTNLCNQIYLEPSKEHLGEVIITGYVTSGIDRNADGSIAVVQKTLGILPGLVAPDILQSIQLIPGINAIDESASGIQIRGGTPDQNLILFDDIKLFNAGYFYGMFSLFNPYATEKAHIYKSGTSAEYGDRISGIIDISSSDRIPEKSSYGVGIDGLSIDGYSKIKVSDKLGISVFGRRAYTDVWQTPTYEGYAEKIFKNAGIARDINGDILTIDTDDDFDINSSDNEFTFYDVNAKLIYTPTDNDKIALSTLITRNGLDFSFTNDGETKVDSLVTQNNGVSLNWKHTYTTDNYNELSAYFSNYKSHYNNIEIVNNTLEETNIRENAINDFGISWKAIRKIDQRHSMRYGYQLSNTSVAIDIIKEEPAEPEDNQFLKEKQSNLKNAAFAEYQYSTKQKGLLGAGIRLVHYGSLGEVYVEPRINIEQPLFRNLRFKGSAERRHQPISQLIEFNQTELRLDNNVWRLSDDTYPLLQSDQLSAGILFNHRGWTFDVDLYHKKLKGLTSFTNGFSTPQFILSEGESTIKGVDLLIKKRINNYRVWAGYTYNTINYRFPTIQKDAFPGNNDITHSFRISNSLKVNDFQFSLGWQYRTGEPFTPVVSFNESTGAVTFGELNSSRLQDYHRLDASAIYNFKLKKERNWRGQFGISVLNIYNRKIPLSIIHRSDVEDFGLQLEQVIQRFSLGITPNVSFRVFF